MLIMVSWVLIAVWDVLQVVPCVLQVIMSVVPNVRLITQLFTTWSMDRLTAPWPVLMVSTKLISKISVNSVILTVSPVISHQLTVRVVSSPVLVLDFSFKIIFVSRPVPLLPTPIALIIPVIIVMMVVRSVQGRPCFNVRHVGMPISMVPFSLTTSISGILFVRWHVLWVSIFERVTPMPVNPVQFSVLDVWYLQLIALKPICALWVTTSTELPTVASLPVPLATTLTQPQPIASHVQGDVPSARLEIWIIVNNVSKTLQLPSTISSKSTWNPV